MTKTPSQLQLNDQGELTHLLTLEGLSKEHILHILDTAKQFVAVSESDREVKKAVSYTHLTLPTNREV